MNTAPLTGNGNGSGKAAKPRVVVIGAGIGGCFAAHGLAETHDVTMIELGVKPVDLQQRVRDLGVPCRFDPHIGAGLGGTAKLWHNGLIEIDEDVFSHKWPFPKAQLDPYYEQAYPFLSGGVPRSKVVQGATELRHKFQAMGLPTGDSPSLFYPRVRRNPWETLRLQGRVRLVAGEVTSLEVDGPTRVGLARVQTATGEIQIPGDVFVVAAGGLSTPGILQKLAEKLPAPALQLAGCHYEDHPMAFVGDVMINAPIYRLWNYAIPGTDGNMRMPLVVHQDGLRVSFQLRPAAYYQAVRGRLRSVLGGVRNRPYNLAGYARLLTHWDDAIDILSFRFGIRLPTSGYPLLMVAEQPASTSRAVSGGIDAATGAPIIQRSWTISPQYIATLRSAIDQLLTRLGGVVKASHQFPEWETTLHTAAHHSGTARMSASPDDGVCDANARVHGVENLYVVDGSLIPGSGIANTGLTIAALGLRFADHLAGGDQLMHAKSKSLVGV